MNNKIMKKFIKRIAAVLLSAALLSGCVLGVSAESGNGTADSPWLISTAAALQNIANDLSAHYKLTNNIDLSSIDSFAPIGNEVAGAFTGSLDGAGYTVSNLTIAAEDEKYVGLIGYNEGTVKNLTVTNADISGGRYTGGIAGYNATDSVISGCTVSGKINGYTSVMDAFSGGIVGYNGGQISQCTNSADVAVTATDSKYSPSRYAGGIIGYNTASLEISNCSNSGAINGSLVGGILGYADASVNITDCNNYGIITAESAGGILGYASEAYLQNCCNTGSITGIYLSGIVLYAETVVATNCINKGVLERPVDGTATSITIGGIVGEANDATITGCSNIIYGSTIVGRYTGGIIALVVGSANITDCLNTSNLCASTSDVECYSGGTIGYASGKIYIDNCRNTGNLELYYRQNSYSDDSFGGGIIGYSINNTLKISNCVNSGNISGAYFGGGILGYSYNNNNNIEIENCVNSGFLSCYTPGSIIGGYVKDNYSAVSYTIKKCSNTGKITEIVPDGYSYYYSIPEYRIEYVSETDNYDIGHSFGFDSSNKNSYYWNQGEYDSSATAKSLEELKNITDELNTTEEEVWISDPMYNSGLPMLKDSPARLLLNEAAVVLSLGETAQLSAYYDNIATADVKFKSLNTSAVSISSTGLVTAKANGSACIAVRTPEGERANCWVFVITESSSLSLPEEITADRDTYVTVPVTTDENANELVYLTSSDTSVADIYSDGSFYCNTAGTAVITAYAPMSGLTDTCLLTVIDPPISRLSLSSSYNVNIGTPYKLSPTVSPNPYRGTIYWSSSDESVATVDDEGYITGIKPGSAVITATSDTGYSAQTTVTVKQPSDGITLNYSSYTLDIGLTLQLKATVTPENTTDTVTYSSNSSVATVNSNGLVTAKYAGTAKITAKTTSGKTAYCLITVNPQTVDVTNITLNTSSTRLSVAEKQQLTATVTPSDATDKTLVWHSSDESVVTVSESGVIEGISQGTATITVSTANGLAAECVVNVVDYSTLTSAFSIGSASAKAGETVKIAVSVKDNPGLAAFTHTLSFESSYLTLNSVTPAEALGGEFIADISDGTVSVSWFDLDNHTQSGELYLLEFTVSDTAPVGDIPLILSFEDSDICNADGDTVIFLTQNGNISVYEYEVGDINLDYLVGTKDIILLNQYLLGNAELSAEQLANADLNADGSINVKDRVSFTKLLLQSDYRDASTDSVDGAPEISIGNAEGSAGDTVTVKLALSEEITACGMLLSLEYDTSALTLDSVSFSFEEGTHNYHPNSGYTNILWISSSNAVLSGEFITLEFTVSSAADLGEYPIKLYCVPENVTDYGLQTIAVNTAYGAVTVTKSAEVEGDVDGDGLCNSADLTALRKILLGKQSAENTNADVNNNGSIDVVDLVALKKLAGE